MKISIIIYVASAIIAGASVRNDSTNRIKSPSAINQTYYSQTREMDYKSNQDNAESIDLNMKHPKQMKSLTDGVMMLEGKMMLVMEDQITLFEHNMTMTDGTTIMPDGSYINIEGTLMIFNEGNHIDMSGKIVPIDQAKKSNNPIENADIHQNINDSDNPFCPWSL